MDARSSVFLDGLDDNATFTSTAHGTGAHSLLCRFKPQKDKGASDQAAVSRGTNAANAGTFLGLVNDGGVRYLGGGVVGTTLHEPQPWSPGPWRKGMVSFAGGAGGALKLFLDGAAPISTVASPNLVSTVGRIGSIAGSAGSWFAGLVYDAIEYDREVTQAEYDLWRLTGQAPANPLRRYRGDDGIGTVLLDSSVNGVNATMVGALWSPDVPFRRRRIVENVAACPSRAEAGVADNADLRPGTDSFSLGGWIIAPPPGVALNLAYKYAASAYIFLDVPTSGLARMRLYDGTTLITCQAGSTVRPMTWLHLVGVRDNNAGKAFLFINGQLRAAVALGALGDVDNNAGWALANPAAACGGINDLVWWKGRPLTWDEDRAWYFDSVVPAADAATRIGWAMREGSGTTVASSPAGYNGTLSAASWSTATRSKERKAA